ncbi:MAG: replicative DNA helicase [Micavibrio aeruginosavorus]|uniref:Replicative DNA helicase n=1 Tax=Micavibrio aeruginosavorus TaxID=349221 RepID=A0A7T5R312_9BACT|nr:MAG: replicative DNA helicase [Micavibrio aeruginosavorus]
MSPELARKANQNTPPLTGIAERAYRVMPHNLEAEQGLLGALLIDNRAMERIGDFLKASHFFHPAHQRVYSAIQKLIDRGQSATPVTLKGYFEQDQDLSNVGGAEYLAELAASVISVVNADDYARTIYELHLRRELIAVGEDVVNESFDQKLEEEPMSVLRRAEGRLYDLAQSGDVKGGFVSLRDSVKVAIEIAEKAFRTEGHVTGVTTGLRDLDEKLGGLHPSDLLILAGRPSMGKTALAVNIAYNAAQAFADTGGKEGGRVAFFSLEMSADQLATRILADLSGISGDAIRKGNFREDDFRKFVQAAQKLSQVPLYIDDTPALSISAVRSRARRLQRQHGLELLVVDYLQLLAGTGSRQSTDNRVLEISEITRGLKAIAKELQIPVLALSQLSRAVEQREDKRPMLSDLRESGSIEQDADVVMFVYREEYYLSRSEPSMDEADKYAKWQEKMGRAHNVAESIIAKQRHGPIGTVRLFFNPDLTRFSDLEQTHSDRPDY